MQTRLHTANNDLTKQQCNNNMSYTANDDVKNNANITANNDTTKQQCKQRYKE